MLVKNFASRFAIFFSLPLVLIQRPFRHTKIEHLLRNNEINESFLILLVNHAHWRHLKNMQRIRLYVNV